MTFTMTATCVLCEATFEAHTSYGLCALCQTSFTLREFDRLESAIREAERRSLPVALTLSQWLASVSDSSGRCKFCGVVPFSLIQIVRPELGLVWRNVVPACRSCAFHWQHGWQNAVDRVYHYLAEFEDEEEDEEDGVCGACEEDDEREFTHSIERRREQHGEPIPGFLFWYQTHFDPYGQPRQFRDPKQSEGGPA